VPKQVVRRRGGKRLIVGASIPWPSPGVGCFDPAMVLHRLGEAFGDALEFDTNDLFDRPYERVDERENDEKTSCVLWYVGFLEEK
jgi:hypothetical protein